MYQQSQNTLGSQIGIQSYTASDIGKSISDVREDGYIAQMTERAFHALGLINEVRGVAIRNADRLMGSEPQNASSGRDSSETASGIGRLDQVLTSLVLAAEEVGYQVNRFSKL